MPGFFSKIKGAFASPSTARKSKSTNDLTYNHLSIYVVKEKELPKLHLAAWKGDLDKTIQLCRPDKLNSIDKDGRTPIHLAVAGNNLDVVQHLLSEDAKLQILDREGRSCLIIASIRGNPQLMEILLNSLEQKSLVNMADKNGLNPLLYAIKNDNFQIMKVLLKEKNINLDHKDKDRNTALHYAVIRKKIDAIDLLVEHGADLDAQNADGQTPLMLAAKTGDEELIDVLLDYGADKLIQDKLGINALKFAEMNGNPRCQELLRTDRPVKPNTSKLTRIKRSVSSDNNLSISERSNPTGPTTTGTKKFENLFAGRQKSSEEKHKTDEDGESNTSRINTDKSKQFTQNNKSNKDTWDDDENENNSENDTDSFDETNDEELINIDLNAKIKPNKHENNKNDMDFLFQNLKPSNDSKIDHSDFDIQFNEDIFTTQNNNNNNNNINKNNKDSNVMTRSGSYTSENGVYSLSSFLPHKKNQTDSNWVAYVHTSNINGAGTDANVYIEIHGDRASSTRMKLDNKNVKDQFESGKIDKFDLLLPEIGEPKRIKIGHDNKGSFAGWHLEKVILENNLSKKKYSFNCNRWLAKDELDHKTEIDINVSENILNKMAKSRDSLTSSWNSSEDEDSLSTGKKRALSPLGKSNVLNQIDEVNETLKSKNNSVLNQSKPHINTENNSNKPPEISDFDESFSEKNDSLPKEPAKGSLAFLIKNNPPKNNINLESTGPFSVNDTINKLLGSTDSNQDQPKQSALSDLWKTDKNNNNIKRKDDKKISFDFSDDEKSHSITDLYNQFTSINNNKPSESQQQPARSNVSINDNESSVEFLIKNNLIPSPPLNSTVREMAHLDIMPAANNKNNNKPSTITALGGIFKDQDNFDQSESLDDLEDMFNKAKEGSNKPKEANIERPLGLVIKNNTSDDFQNKDSPKNETLASLLNKEKPQLSSANPTLSNIFNSNKSKPNSIEENYIKSIKNSIEYSNNDFESDDEIEDLVKPKLSKSGTIGAAIGAVVVGNSGNSGLNRSTSSIKSIPNFNNNNKDKQYASSFTSIIPELFESNNNDNSNIKSPRKTTVDQNDSALNELVNKLRLKNNELEKDKLELESKLRELDMEKKKFEMLFNHSDKELAEKEKLIDKMNEEKLKSEYAMKSELNELKILRKEINDLKEDKHALENKLSLYQAATTLTATSANQSTKSIDENNNNASTLANLNESLNIKIKALENQIEELNKDRKILSACKEDLSIKLEETESDISKRNEALELATYKFNLEKKALTDENIKLKKDYNELNETRKKLQQEIDSLKLELNDKLFNYEKLNLEKSNYENQFNREKEDNEKVRRNYDFELNQLKDQHLKLSEKLSTAEAKLISTERDLKYTQNQIDEKERQITSLRDELVKSKSDYSVQLNLLKIEKEEKENLIRKCESLEASLKKNNEEYNSKSSKLSRSSKLDIDEDDKNRRDLTQLEKENSELNKEVKNLIEKLNKTEYEFEKFKTEAELNALKNAMKPNNNYKEERTPPLPHKDIIINSENEKLKNEVQKLRNDFNEMLNKYSNLENNISNSQNHNTLNGGSTLPKSHIIDYDNRNKTDFLIRQNPVDVPALITDMPLKTIAKLNNYLIQNIITQEDPSNTPNLVVARGNNLYSMPIPTLNDIDHHHKHHISQSNQSPKINCKLCSSTQNSSYFDLLKNEMSKKIEIEVAKGTPVTSLNYSPRTLNTIHLNNDRSTDNFDSLYNTINLNSRYSSLLNNNNTDLINSLRTRFLI